MKILVQENARGSRRQDGSAVVVMLALLGLMLVYIGMNARTLHFLGEDLKLIEQRQIKRLQVTTNSPPTLSWTVSPPLTNR
jgi:hypothetical protein